MTHPRRLALAATTLAALSALTACGGNGSSSTSSDPSSSPSTSSTPSASTSSSSTSSAAGGDLCQVFASGPQGLSSNDPATAVAAAHAFASQLQGVTAPSDISASASSGLQAYADFLGGIDVAKIKALEANKEASPSDVFGDKSNDVQGFFAYIQQTCVPASAPTASPTQ